MAYNRRVLNYYQPFLWPFLRHQKSKLSAAIAQYYFLSFEDALWEVLPNRGVIPGSLILVPDFYCLDVVENIHAHGYKTAFYQLDANLQPIESQFRQQVIKTQPSAVILFHAAGIQCDLVNRSMIEWLGLRHCLVIEDCVQRLVNPEEIHLFGKHHLVMDSLRKVSPLPGSMVYGLKSGFLNDDVAWSSQSTTLRHWDISIRAVVMEYGYQYLSAALFCLFQTLQAIAVLTHSPKIMRFSHQVVLRQHDALIGDSRRGYSGWSIWRWLHQYIDFAKVARLKRTQVEQYERVLEPLLRQQRNFFYSITISDREKGSLHVFPLGLRRPITQTQIDWLHGRGAVIWPKFPDSEWAKDKSVLFLPLGFHVTKTEIDYLAQLLSVLPGKV